jgi:hypothetical protein
MTMRPEQEKVLDYLSRRGTLLAPREICERVRGAFVATAEFLDGISAADARQRPAPGKWCVQEIVDHLVETHRPSVEELRCLLRGERPAHGPIPAGLQSRAPLERPWSELVGELKRLHTAVLGILAGVPEGFTTEARAPVVMVVPTKNPDGSEHSLHWVEELDWKAYAIIFRLHELDHLKQAQRALRAAGREA